MKETIGLLAGALLAVEEKNSVSFITRMRGLFFIHLIF
jgi:hypothetical protein